MKTAANSRTGRNLNMGFFHYNNLPDSFSFSLEQWTFAPEANIIVYLAQRGAGVTGLPPIFVPSTELVEEAS